MKNRRIIFILEPFEFPLGGVGVIYDHAEILSLNGFNAFVALSKKPSIDFYNSKAPLIIGNDITYQEGDIYVIPEGFLGHMQALRHSPAKKIMFCQNQYYMPFSDNPLLGFSEFPVDGVIASSQSIRSFLKQVYGLSNVPLIPCSIDTLLYSSSIKKKQIAFMPRKLRDDAAFICATFKRIYKQYADIPWVAIDNMDRNSAAEIMNSSELFLSLSHKDSFGLPPLEAMASGCLVAGYHGDGGREYMNKKNGWWAENGDWLACVNGLASALDLIDTGGFKLNQIKEQMKITVERYSRDKMQEKLISYWTEEVKTPYTKEKISYKFF